MNSDDESERERRYVVAEGESRNSQAKESDSDETLEKGK
jgi:hypothetical protein